MPEIPAAFAVAQAEFGPVTLERCSCGCLKPQGTPCPNRYRPQGEALPLFTPAPAQMPGQTMMGEPYRETPLRLQGVRVSPVYTANPPA